MKNLNVFGKILCASGLLSIVGMIVYLVNTLTGYLAGRASINPLALVLPIVCLLGTAILVTKGGNLPGFAVGAATVVIAVLLAWATVVFITERVDVISDMFNPVNHPDSQATAVTWSLVGIALYFLSFLSAAVSTIGEKLKK